MRLTSRLSVSLILGVAAVSLAFAFYQTRAQSLSMQRDLREHALMLGESLARATEPLVAERSHDQLRSLVERFKDRETVAGVAAYDAAGTPLVATTGLFAMLGRTPPSVSQALHNGWASEEFIAKAAWPIHVAAVPLRDGASVTGALAIVNDTGYIGTRAAALWRHALLGVAVQTIVIVGITLLSVRLGVGRPLHHMTQWMRDLRAGKVPAAVTHPGALPPS